METNLETASAETRTSKEYFQQHRGRVMVVCGKEGRAPESRHFFLVDAVDTLPDGLLVTGLFDHNRRERMRSPEVRLATEWEIASRNGNSD